MLKNFIKNLINRIPFKKCIVFESVPDLSDNTMSVFLEMLHRKLNDKYKLVWLVSDKNKLFPKYKNTIYIDTKSTYNRIKFLWYVCRSKCLISCNSMLAVDLPKSKCFYLTHATTIKKLHKYVVPKEIDYVLVAAKSVIDFMAKEMQCDINKFYPLGYPRNDVIQNANRDLKELFDVAFEKIVVWYPTFRQHKNGLKTDSANALPIIHDAEKAIALNECAKRNKILLVVKPHFAQDTTKIKTLNLSNLVLIDDSFFEKNNISSYEFVGSCDALLTDYSSIYFDYLLCDKPIGLIWEDFEEYQKNPGFAIDMDYFMKAGVKIYSLSDFIEFLDDLTQGRDFLANEREEICALVNCSKDGQNSKRVVDFIVEKAGL